MSEAGIRFRRRGVAATEAAVVLPVLIILVFGSIELANAIFLRQAVNIAAYEAAKVVTTPGDHNALAAARCKDVLSMRKVSHYTLKISPPVTSGTPAGTIVTVTVSAPADNLSYGPVRFFRAKTISSSVTMSRQ